MMNGIDVSSHQSDIDWAKVKASGVEFAVIRATFGSNASGIDKKFSANVEGCAQNGLPYGLYHYSYAVTAAEAEAEAEHFLAVAAAAKPALPVFFDFEEGAQLALAPAEQLDVVEAFLDKVAAAGYSVGLYASKSSLVRLLNADSARVEKYKVWLAQWNTKPTYSGRFDLWQRSSTGTVDGIPAKVDLDVCYIEPTASEDSEDLAESVVELKSRLAKIAEIANG